MIETEAITDSAGLNGPVTEKAAPKKRTAKSTTTAKAAKSAPEIIDASVAEAKTEDVNEDGQKVITGPKKTSAPKKSNTKANEGGVISSGAADRSLAKAELKTDSKPETKKEQKKQSDKVALWSASNIRWTGVGSLSKGYNIINKEAAEKWLGRNGVRKATPEEVATHFGK